MPVAFNELDVHVEVQIDEIKRLISTTTDEDRRASLEDQLRGLELQSIQLVQERQLELQAADNGSVQTPEQALHTRRKSFRPMSAKPRATLSTLAEDVEVNLTSTSFHGLESYRLDGGGLPLVAEVFSSSYDEQFAPTNVLTSDHNSRWVSSGLFPQFLRLVLREPFALESVEITCRHVERLEVRSAPSKNAPRDRMTLVGELGIASSHRDKLDTHIFKLEDKSIGADAATRNSLQEVVEIDITGGYSDFVVVYFVRIRPVNGNAVLQS